LETKKKHLAIIGVGVVGIPVLAGIIEKLAQRYSITVYSFIPVKNERLSTQIRIRCMPNFPIHQRIKYVLLGLWFVVDHMLLPYAVIHAQSAFPGGVLARFLGKYFKIPWMVTLIGGEVESISDIPFGDLLNRKLRRITYNVCNEAQYLAVMSGYHALSVRKNLNLTRDIEVLPYAPLVKSIDSKEITTPVKLLHVAYCHPVKNQDMLLSTISKLITHVPLHLKIIGANYGELFRKKVQALNLNEYVTIVGPKPYEDLVEYYNEAHILLHTSWYEGLPTVAFEAMAHGVVVCGTRVGIMADLAETHCLAVEPGDDEKLVQVVLRVIEDRELFQRLRENAYAWAKENDLNHYVNRITGLYEQMINQ
jgi:glycosyltransferase involved in cell wall biosynthesis